MKGILKRLIVILAGVALFALLSDPVDTLAKVKHNVTFVYGLKSVTVSVDHGKNAPVPTDTAVPGFQFLSWIGNAANVTEDRIIIGAYAVTAPATTTVTPITNTPQWLKKINNNKSAAWPEWWSTVNLPKGVPGKTCAVHWMNGWNGELWKTDIIPYGSSIQNPPDPCIGSYDFCGWEGDWTNVTEDRVIKAYYYVKYKIKVIDDLENDVIDILYPRDGDSVWVDPPHHDGWEFDHYQRSDGGGEYNQEPIHCEFDLYAIYKPKP